MAKLTLDDLRKLRDEKQKAIEKRDPSNKDAQIIVGMGTCGIAAGAKETFNAIIDELDAKNISHVLVRQTGCMIVSLEPTVEVIVPDMPTGSTATSMLRSASRSTTTLSVSVHRQPHLRQAGNGHCSQAGLHNMSYKQYILVCGGTACDSIRGMELFNALKTAVKENA